MGSADPPGKMDEKLKSETYKKEQFSMSRLYFESIKADRCRERRYADHIIYSDILQNAPLRSQNFRRLRRQGGIDPRNQNPADVTARMNANIGLYT